MLRSSHETPDSEPQCRVKKSRVQEPIFGKYPPMPSTLLSSRNKRVSKSAASTGRQEGSDCSSLHTQKAIQKAQRVLQSLSSKRKLSQEGQDSTSILFPLPTGTSVAEQRNGRKKAIGQLL